MAKQTFSVGQVLTAAQLTSLQQTAMGGGAASAKTASYTLVAADAGTTISMTSTSATTITVNTGLFAAGDTVFIQNLGSGNCTVTAGTATVSTAGSLILPTNDAGILYFVSTGVAVFYDFIQVGATSPLTTKGDLYGFSTSDARIPIGANNTVLTADSNESLGLKWAAPASGSTFVGVRCSGDSTKQIISNTTTTAINWNVETFDTNGFHSTASNTSRITIPSGKTGYYKVYAQLTFNNNAATANEVNLQIYKNGSRIVSVIDNFTGNTGINHYRNYSDTIYLTATDYLEVYTYQNTGSNLNVYFSDSGTEYSWFGLELIGA